MILARQLEQSSASTSCESAALLHLTNQKLSAVPSNVVRGSFGQRGYTNQDCRDDESLVSEAVDQLRVRLGEVPREVCPVVLVPGSDLGETLLLQLDNVQFEVSPETL